MNKLNLESKDMISNNIDLISQLFPHCITEQEGKKVVDFSKLKEEFTNDIVDETKEKYELNWPGKRAAINEARIKTDKTLLPLEGKSVNFENTNNVYIEGDNLEVLKLLQESYLNKIKCIYIDPPYNTGKDFIYKDDFKQTSEDELIESGQIDEEGNKFVQNTETNGRYHSDWLSMMYPRLKLAKNLLNENGILLISIDDNEYDNIKKLCDEIFGEKNCISTAIKKTKSGGGSDSKFFALEHEYLLIYAKNIDKVAPIYTPHDETYLKRYKEQDEISKYFWDTFARPGLKNPIKYDIKMPDGSVINYGWIWSKKRFDDEYKKGNIRFDKVRDKWSVKFKQRLNLNGKKPRTLLTELGGTSEGKKELSQLMGKNIFSYPKSIDYLTYILELFVSPNDIILDFFSGSSTTAHSVLDCNSREDRNLKYIMVQLPETIYEKNNKAAYDFCIENDLEPIIPSIAQERIKRAGAKIKEETGADIDYGFRVFKLSDSILKANEVLPSDLQQDLLSESDSKYVDGISKLDIVTSVILDLGLMLDSKIENIGNDNFIVEEDLLFISLSEEYDNSVLDSIRDIMPDQVVLDEKTFGGNDALMTNVIQQINEINSDITINIL